MVQRDLGTEADLRKKPLALPAWPEVPVMGKTDYCARHGTWKNPPLCSLLPQRERGGSGGPWRSPSSTQQHLVPADGGSTASTQDFGSLPTAG